MKIYNVILNRYKEIDKISIKTLEFDDVLYRDSNEIKYFNFCEKCGENLKNKNYCSNCGNRNYSYYSKIKKYFVIGEENILGFKKILLSEYEIEHIKNYLNRKEDLNKKSILGYSYFAEDDFKNYRTFNGN